MASQATNWNWFRCMNLLILFIHALAGRDFYTILGVSRTSDTSQIKRAYRKLAKELHPDKNKKDPDADEKFKTLGAAYEVLSDPEKRRIYDRHGEDGLKKADGKGDQFSNFFGDFGFNFGGMQNQEREVYRGGNITINIDVTLEELYNGHFVELLRYKPVIRPAKGKRKCNCRMEMVTQQMGHGQFSMNQQQVCDKCPNIRFVSVEKPLDFEIEPGMRDQHEHHFIAEGEPHIDGEPGDLKLKVCQVKHPRFERRGDDLYTNVTVALIDALSGFKMQIEHLDGHMVDIVREKITWPGARMRRSNEGMPNYEDNSIKGAMYITFDVIFPKGLLSEENKKDLKNILNQTNKPMVYNGLQGY